MSENTAKPDTSISQVLLAWLRENNHKDEDLSLRKAGVRNRHTKHQQHQQQQHQHQQHAKPAQIKDGAAFAANLLASMHSANAECINEHTCDQKLLQDEYTSEHLLNEKTSLSQPMQEKTIKALQFGLSSPDSIRLTSVCEVTKQRLFENGAPVIDGLYDLRMGSMQRQFQCASCSLSFKDCPGHFGRIELASPVFNFIHIEKIVKVLNCICVDCSALLVPKTKRFIERQAQCKRGVERLKMAHEAIKGKLNKQCCGTEAALRHHAGNLSFCAMSAAAAAADSTAQKSSTYGVAHAGLAASATESIQALEQGCGHYQPKVMREGHRLVLKYPVLPASAVGGKKETKEIAKQAAKQAKQAEKAATAAAAASKKKSKKTALAPANDESALPPASSLATAPPPIKEYDRVRQERADTQRYIDAEEVLRIFRRISDEDCWLLGFDPQNGHPAWMILTVLPVPPPCLRPAIITPNGRKAITHDELTLTLIEIVKINNKLRKQIQGNIQTFQENYKLLLYNSVVALIDNDGKAFPKAMISEASQIPRNGVAQRLKGKTGRIRGNMMGKRTDFSARSVITPDANLALNQVGVPKKMALILTYPERVNQHNIERLQTAVLLGPERLAGAKFVIDESGVRWDLKYCKGIKLKIGYVVERHLRDGDLVTMNRQPSLHKESIMAFYVRLMDGNTLRLNLSVCTPFNADFDGDEMNLGVPQSEEARAELYALLEASQCLITPQTNKPSMGLVQDSLLATRLLTMRDAFLTRADIMQLLMYAPISFAQMKLPQPAILRPKPLWTGKQIVSLLFPRALSLGPSGNRFRPDEEHAGDAMTPSDCRVWIHNGVLLSGVLEKKFVGVTHGSIIHVLTKDYGAQVARTFIEELQGVAQAYVTIVRGFSVGLADCIASDSVRNQVQHILTTAESSANEIVRQFNAGEMETLPGRTVHQTLEENLRSTLSRAHDKSGRAVKDAMPLHGNNLKLMVTAGSKGGDANIAQIAGCVGQQNLNGGRIPCMFQDRAMPHSLKNDLNDFESRGWINRSFVQGLTPTQMFSHACGGREGLLDTAVKTAYIGYIQRRLIKAGEDVSVAHDGTVRNSAGRIVQFVYGDDGMDGACFEWQPIDFLSMNNEQVDQCYGICGIEFSLMEQESRVLSENAQFIKKMRDEIRRAVYPLTDTHFPLPNNISRSIAVADQMQGRLTQKQFISICEAARVLKEFEHALVSAIDPAKIHSQRTHNSIAMYIALIYANLAPRLVCRRFSFDNFRWLLLEHLVPQFVRARVAPGEASGVLAAQAIGEPATQMTFNSFHLSGTGNVQLMMGVPRLEELIKVGGSIKTPSLTLHLLNAEMYARGEEEMQRRAGARARLLAGRLSGANLGTVLRSVKVLYEPVQDRSKWSSGTRDIAAVDSWYAYEPPNVRLTRDEQLGIPLDWVIRIEISRSAAHERSLTPSAIARLIFQKYEGSLEVIPSDDNDWSAEIDSDDGGFIRVRMYAQSVYHSLIASLPEILQAPIVNLENQLESNSTGTAPNSTTTPMRTKRQKVSSEIVSNRSSGGDCKIGGGGAVLGNFMSANCANSNESRTSSDLIGCRPPSAATLSADAKYEENSMIEEIWKTLDARVCVPMILQHLCNEIESIELDGIRHITSATVRQQSITLYCAKTGDLLKKAQEWIIETFDANTSDKKKPHRSLRETLCLYGIDHSRTRCNNPAEVAEVFGIEAARICLFRELRNVLQFNGEYVNYRHIEMLCDIMTQSGSLMAVNRHGLNRRQTGPLMRATLEESVTMLTSAGCFSEFDSLMGPSERVATGRRIHSGTGSHIDVLIADLVDAVADKPHPRTARYEIRRARDAKAAPSTQTSAFSLGYDRNQRFEEADLADYLKEQNQLASTDQKIGRNSKETRWLSAEDSLAAAERVSAQISNPFGAQTFAELPQTVLNNDLQITANFSNPFEAKTTVPASVDDYFKQQNATFDITQSTTNGYISSKPIDCINNAANTFSIATSSSPTGKNNVPACKRRRVCDPFASDSDAKVFSFENLHPISRTEEQRRLLFYVPSEPKQ